MPFVVECQDIWVASLRDKPGGLAEKLTALEEAGADLDFVIARRAPEQPGGGVVFVTPLRTDHEVEAATEMGFNVSRSLHALRIEGPNRPGIAAEMTRRLAEEGISLRGFSAAASGKKVIVNLAVDSLAEKDRVKTLLDGWREEEILKLESRLAVPVGP